MRLSNSQLISLHRFLASTMSLHRSRCTERREGGGCKCAGRGGERRGQEAGGRCGAEALGAGGRRGGDRTHILHEKGASGIQHELVGVKHVPAVRLKLDVTQLWVIDHGSEVGQQQTEGELEGGSRWVSQQVPRLQECLGLLSAGLPCGSPFCCPEALSSTC